MIPGLCSPDGFSQQRQRLHEAALATFARFEGDGTPFALVLRTFRILQLFGETPFGDGEHIMENWLFDALQSRGVGLVTIQEQKSKEYDLILSTAGLPQKWLIRAPALLVDDKRWLDAVTHLIDRAELIVVLLLLDSTGVVRELETIVSRSRADRTTVVLLESYLTTLDRAGPILSAFPRVVQGSELDSKQPLDSFVWHDLVRRMAAIAQTPVAQRREMRAADLDRAFPISFDGVAAGYAKIAVDQRRQKHFEAGAASFGRGARLAFLTADAELGAECCCQQATMLNQLGRPAAALDSIVQALASLGALRPGSNAESAAVQWARTMLTIHQVDYLSRANRAEAKGMLEQLLAEAHGRGDRRSESAVLAKLARLYRGDRDAIRALNHAKLALQAAEIAGDSLCAAAALGVMGTLFHDIDEDQLAISTFRDALLHRFPRPGVHEDEWLMQMKLGTIAAKHTEWQEAISCYRKAAEVAEVLGLPAELKAAQQAAEAIDAPGRTGK